MKVARVHFLCSQGKLAQDTNESPEHIEKEYWVLNQKNNLVPFFLFKYVDNNKVTEPFLRQRSLRSFYLQVYWCMIQRIKWVFRTSGEAKDPNMPLHANVALHRILLKISFVLDNTTELIPLFNPLKRDGNKNNYIYILLTMALHVEAQCIIL